MRRRSFLRTVGAVGAGIALPAILRSASPGDSRRRPNLVVFLPDQQRADTLACYGGARVQAPRLNRLAEESILFDRAYVSHPVCTPSRSTLLTGLWPHQNGCTHNNMALDQQHACIPQMLGAAADDYRTGYMGKWHLGDEVFAQRGFQEWVSIEDLYQDYFTPGRDRKAISDYSRFLRERGHTPDNAAEGSFSRRYASRLPIALSKPVFLADRACSFIRRHRREPFILFVSFLEPHSPYFGPLNDLHPVDEVALEPTASRTFGSEVPLRYRLKQEYLEREFGTSLDGFRRTKQRYLGLVAQIDRSIGRILDQLDASGVADSTIVMHTSDHGDMMGAHRLFEKEVMFEPAVRVPWLIRLPGQRRQQRVAAPVSHIDFVPTALDLLGLPPDPQCAGRSLAPVWRDPATAIEPVIIEWSPNSGREKYRKDTTLASEEEIRRALGESTRTVVDAEGWKLSLRTTDLPELYNLASDPYEMGNRFHRPESASPVRRLRAAIESWQTRTADPVALARV